MIDLHSHILPGLDDGARSWEEALEMARMAVKDGLKIIVATPHLYRRKVSDPGKLNNKSLILDHIEQFKQKLSEAGIPLEILPGCDVPLCLESLELLEQDLILTINDQSRYLLLELPDTSIPPATEEICFRLKAKGLTPIITHPERNIAIYETPEKLTRLLQVGCLAQVTAASLLGGFGRAIAKCSRQLVKQGYIQVLATDAHNTRNRPPKLRRALTEVARLIGQDRAWAMVTTIPEKILRGEPVS